MFSVKVPGKKSPVSSTPPATPEAVDDDVMMMADVEDLWQRSDLTGTKRKSESNLCAYATATSSSPSLTPGMVSVDMDYGNAAGGWTSGVLQTSQSMDNEAGLGFQGQDGFFEPGMNATAEYLSIYQQQQQQQQQQQPQRLRLNTTQSLSPGTPPLPVLGRGSRSGVLPRSASWAGADMGVPSGQVKRPLSFCSSDSLQKDVARVVTGTAGVTFTAEPTAISSAGSTRTTATVAPVTAPVVASVAPTNTLLYGGMMHKQSPSQAATLGLSGQHNRLGFGLGHGGGGAAGAAAGAAAAAVAAAAAGVGGISPRAAGDAVEGLTLSGQTLAQGTMGQAMAGQTGIGNRVGHSSPLQHLGRDLGVWAGARVGSGVGVGATVRVEGGHVQSNPKLELRSHSFDSGTRLQVRVLFI
ncbi:unnamed protein product [Choristocarpus tenellus]